MVTEDKPMFIVVHPCSSSLRATSTLLDEVCLHQGHPLCMKSWLQCLQEFLQIKALILQILCKTLPQTSSTPWISCSLNYPCTPSISSLESSMLRPVNEPPSTLLLWTMTPTPPPRSRHLLQHAILDDLEWVWRLSRSIALSTLALMLSMIWNGSGGCLIHYCSTITSSYGGTWAV